MSLESELEKIENRLSDHIKIHVSSLHGISHLREVALLAGEIAHDSGVDVESAMLAGFLHDVGRTNDFYDPAHGANSASIAAPLLALYYPHVDANRICHAIKQHAAGLTTDDPLAGALWDADRLTLPRVGLRVREDMLSTDAAKRILRQKNDDRHIRHAQSVC